MLTVLRNMGQSVTLFACVYVCTYVCVYWVYIMYECVFVVGVIIKIFPNPFKIGRTGILEAGIYFHETCSLISVLF